jgi:hypothetical protein
MRLRVVFRSTPLFILLSSLVLAAGCGNAPGSGSASSSSRSYSGTASVGDFMNLTLDSTAQTITYTNLSNGDSGVVPYTVNSDGTYTLNDPAGNLVAAYEIPGYAMLVDALKAGSDHATPALVTAVAESQVTLAMFENHGYNYMQFRTAAGGMEAGSVILDAQGNVSVSSYWPYGATLQNSSAFHSNVMPGGNFTEDASGNFLRLSDQGGTDFVFGTAQGIFVVDTGNGAILGLGKTATKNFDPVVAGTYHAIYYQKTNATTGQGNIESGVPSLGNATLVIDAQGNLTAQDAQNHTLMQAALTPVADASYLYGSPGQLADPCNGLFTFRISTANSQQDVFVSLMGRAVLFSSFTAALPLNGGSPYQYLYGVGLK